MYEPQPCPRWGFDAARTLSRRGHVEIFDKPTLAPPLFSRLPNTMNTPAVCTIIAKNYLAHARVVCASFLEQHPEGRAYVLVIDGHEGFIDPAAESFTLLTLDALRLPETREVFCFKYSVVELATAVKPFLLTYLLKERGERVVFYLDPDILVTGSLSDLVDRLETGSGLLITPHLDTDVPDDGRHPADGLFLAHGAFNLGFFGVRAGPAADRFLPWLEAKLADRCSIDKRRSYFVDQKFFDLGVSLFPELEIERGVGYNAAYWNAHSRTLTQGPGGGWLCNGTPLAFFHFSSYRPEQPNVISRYQNRLDFADRPDLAAIFAEYRQRLLAAGYKQCRAWPYGFAAMPDGLPIPSRLREIYRDKPALRRRFPKPFHSRGLRRAAIAVGWLERGERLGDKALEGIKSMARKIVER
jgi:hypothetical protein